MTAFLVVLFVASAIFCAGVLPGRTLQRTREIAVRTESRRRLDHSREHGRLSKAVSLRALAEPAVRRRLYADEV